ncbi:MAG: hypothetical protein ACI9U2_002310 [Bradymonadia bacterium]|jgi:hypothetical protein
MADPQTDETQTDAQTEPTHDPLDETPPLLGSWRNLYLVVLGTLASLVLIFWWLTRHYA